MVVSLLALLDALYYPVLTLLAGALHELRCARDSHFLELGEDIRKELRRRFRGIRIVLGEEANEVINVLERLVRTLSDVLRNRRGEFRNT